MAHLATKSMLPDAKNGLEAVTFGAVVRRNRGQIFVAKNGVLGPKKVLVL